MAVAATYESALTVAETIETGAEGLTDRTVTHSRYNTKRRFGATTYPRVLKAASGTGVSGTGGYHVLLDAVDAPPGVSIDGTGLRVQALKIRNTDPANHTLIVTNDAADGYNGFGPTLCFEIPPGGEILLLSADGGDPIGPTNRSMTFSFSGSLLPPETYEFVLILG